MIKHQGTVNQNGIFSIRQPFKVDIHIPSMAGKEIVVTIEKAKKKRSLNQNSYYHGCVVPIFQGIFNQLGNKFSREQTHDILRAKALTVDVIDSDGVVVAQRIKSTTELTTTQFAEYILELQKWAAEQFETYIPDPNEQVKIQY